MMSFYLYFALLGTDLVLSRTRLAYQVALVGT